jgi:hypothetical protein
MTSPLGVNVRRMILCVWQKTTEVTTQNVSRRRGAGTQPIRTTSGCAPLRAGRKERPHTERGERCSRPGDPKLGSRPERPRPRSGVLEALRPVPTRHLSVPLAPGYRRSGRVPSTRPWVRRGHSRGHTRATEERIPLTEAPKGREHSACAPPRFGGFRCGFRPVRNAAPKKRPKHSRRWLLTSRLLR